MVMCTSCDVTTLYQNRFIVCSLAIQLFLNYRYTIAITTTIFMNDVMITANYVMITDNYNYQLQLSQQ